MKKNSKFDFDILVWSPDDLCERNYDPDLAPSEAYAEFDSSFMIRSMQRPCNTESDVIKNPTEHDTPGFTWCKEQIRFK